MKSKWIKEYDKDGNLYLTILHEKPKEMEKLYFEDEDSITCHPLDYHIAVLEEPVTEVTLMEAIPDDGTNGYVWCTYYGDCVELSECSKSVCPHYSSKSGRGKCSNKGKLYLHGEKVTIQL